jgi:hypothetical protein
MTSARASSQKSWQCLHEQLREHLFALDYSAFNALMHTLLERSGYAPVLRSERKHKRGRTRSGGLDIRAYTRTDLASSLTLVQIKQYRRVVSRRFVDELRGTMLRLGAEQGLLLTTSTFSRVAWRAATFTETAPIGLLDGGSIGNLLVEYRLGVKKDRRGRLRVDTSFFDNLQEKSRSTVEAAPAGSKTPPRVATPSSSASQHNCPSDHAKVPHPNPSHRKPIQSLSTNRASGVSGGDMQWRTHVFIGVTSLWLLEVLPGVIQREQLPMLIGAAAFGRLLPDLDAAQSKIKHLAFYGISPSSCPLSPYTRHSGIAASPIHQEH